MDKRFLLALAISSIVLMVWFGVVHPMLFPPPPKPTPDLGDDSSDANPGVEKAPESKDGQEDGEKDPPPEKKPADENDPETKNGRDDPPPPDGEKPAFEPTKATADQKACLANDHFRLEISGDGATVKRLELLKFLDPDQKKDYPLLDEIEAGARAFALTLDEVPDELGTLPWERVESAEKDRAVFRFRTSTGLECRKSYILEDAAGPVPYVFRVSLEIVNLASEEQPVLAHFTGPAGIRPEHPEQPLIHGYTASGIDPTKPMMEEDLAPSDILETPKEFQVTGRFFYAGVGNKYFGSVVLLQEAEAEEGVIRPEGIETVRFRGVTDSAILSDLLARGMGSKAYPEAVTSVQPILKIKEFMLAPEERMKLEFRVFAGPKKEEYLEALHIEGIRTSSSSFCFPASWTRSLGWIILKLLLFFHGFLGNYGVAIILLTILVRAMMVPLSLRMQVSMQDYQKKMKKIQPRMQEIKEKFKDKQRQQQEMAKLMQEHGVSLLPVKGCLPLLLQFPVFIALFFTLRNSLELRHAHFLWITDLASPDRLFLLPKFISGLPLIGGILGSHFNLLPVLWIGLMLLQQRLSPQAANAEDPQMQQQKKMMLMMSIVFGVLFFKIESGCALYIIVSTLWGLGESFFIRRHIAKTEEP